MDGFNKKFMLLFDDDIDADGDVGGGMVLRAWFGEAMDAKDVEISG
jgi:hypothetical protein